MRLLVVDDHAVVRRGLADLFSRIEGVSLRLAGSGQEALDLLQEEVPDVLLVDLRMPGMDGVETIKRVHALSLGVRIVVLTSFSERDQILTAVQAGACGYLLKDAEPEELVRGVMAAHAGESPFSPKAASALLPTALPEDDETVPPAPAPAPAPAPVPAPSPLTPREQEVVILVAQGLANKQVARRLGISEKTVKAHLTNAFARIGVTDRTQAALWAHRRGLLD